MTLSARVTSYLVAGAIAAGLIFYVTGWASGLLGAKDAAITAASMAKLHAHPALVRFRGNLMAAEQRLAAHQTVDAARADSLRRALASGARVDTVVVLREIAAHDSAAAQSCSIAYRSCAERATSAEAEADSLAAQLRAQLRVHDRRCGFFGGAGVAAGKGLGAGLGLMVGCRLWP